MHSGRHHSGMSILFHIATLVPWIVVIFRTIWPLPIAPPVKTPVAIALLLVSQHHLITKVLTGTMFSPEIPRVAMISVNVAFGAILVLAVIQLVVDCLLLLICAIKRRRVRVAGPVRPIAIAIALTVAAFGVSQALRIPDLKEIELPVAGLPASFDGYRIVQLTDLHLSHLFQADWTRDVVNATNAAGADMIVVTGDLIDGTIEARREDIQPLSALASPDGVWVVPGNHEYYFGHRDWMEHFKRLGMRGLENEHTLIVKDGASITLAGVTDLSATEFGQEGPNVKRAIAGAPPENVVVLLDHQPRYARDAADLGVDVQLSGHTHGGMIFGFNQLIAKFNNGFVPGRYQVGKMALYVSNGTALWIGFALRLGVPSELTVIRLRSV